MIDHIKYFIRQNSCLILLLPSICIFLMMVLPILSFFTSNSGAESQILGLNQKNGNTTVSLTIGEYRFNLFGYTSPKALVTIEGMGIFDQTTANNKGYFSFYNRFSPFSPREACLTAKDQFGRVSTPVCLAPFPTNRSVNIGPVILSPTLSLGNNDYFVGDEVVLSGQTVPDTDVNLSLFIDEKKSAFDYLAGMIVKPAEALTFPLLVTKSDRNGNFSLSVPSAQPDFFRIFAQANYNNQASAQSIVLSLKILPIWMIIIRFFSFVFLLLKPRLLEIMILAQIICLALYSIRRYLKPHIIARNRALVLRQHFDLVKN